MMVLLEQHVHITPQEKSVNSGGKTGVEHPHQPDSFAELGQLNSHLKQQAQVLLGLVPEKQTSESADDSTAIRAKRRARWQQTGDVPPIMGGEDNRKSHDRAGTKIIGRADFSWRRELSEDGKKLYLLLLKEMGDMNLLPVYATEDEFDLNTALDELRKHALLDESDPESIKLISRELS